MYFIRHYIRNQFQIFLTIIIYYHIIIIIVAM